MSTVLLSIINRQIPLLIFLDKIVQVVLFGTFLQSIIIKHSYNGMFTLVAETTRNPSSVPLFPLLSSLLPGIFRAFSNQV